MKPFIPQDLPIQDLNWEAMIPMIGRANRSIAQFEGVLYGVPNPGVLLSPLTIQEAVLSSRIEGTVATFGEVLKFEAGERPEQESRRLDIQEIVNYRMALKHAEEELSVRPFNLQLLLEIHSILLNSVRGKDKSRGRFRTIQNWIGPPNCPIERADFVPPDPMIVMGCLSEWEKYYHSDRPDPLVQLAIVHAQFEIIHPFLDGNGRIGRILIPLFLYEKRLLTRPVFYLSSYIDEHKDEYVERLRGIGRDANGWNEWVGFFLRAVDAQSRANAAKARAIMDLYESMKREVVSVTHSQYGVLLLDQIFQHPIFRTTDISFEGGHAPSRQAVSSLLRTLRTHGILHVVSEGSGRKPQILAFPDLINLCEGADVF